MPKLSRFKPKHVRPVPKPLPGRAIEIRYLRMIRGVLKHAHELVKSRLVAQLADFVGREAHLRVDAKSPGSRVNSILEGVAKSVVRKFPTARLERMARQIGEQTSEHQKMNLKRQVQAAIGIPLESLADRSLGARIRQFTAENVSLIKSIPRQYLADVEKVVHAGLRAGSRAKEISTEIEDRFEVAASRAKLVARDQVLRFGAELDRVRQQDLGIESYIWRTAEDERVRPEHQERDGETYRWDDPPGDPADPATGGHPGRAINCRCWSEPILTLPEEEV